jgi:orotate phosphoribosyltransferase
MNAEALRPSTLFAMTDISVSAFMELATARAGHFGMESGLHSALWLDLDTLFASPTRIEPFIAALADMLRPFRVDAVCGPLLGGAFLAQRLAQILDAEFWFTEPASAADGSGLYRARYRLPRRFITRLARPRLALVDDVMSAGSSLRATYAELDSRTDVVALGSLLQLGSVGASHFAEQRIPVKTVVKQAFETWPPSECPHCAAGAPLESVVAPAVER